MHLQKIAVRKMSKDMNEDGRIVEEELRGGDGGHYGVVTFRVRVKRVAFEWYR